MSSGLHVEAARCHAALHQRPLACQVLADQPVHPIKPPEGELDGPAVEPDHAHHVLVDEANPVPRLEYFDFPGRFFQFIFNFSSSFLNIFCL